MSVQTGNGELVPNGEAVTVRVGAASCVVALVHGKGSCSIANSALAAGSYVVTANYTGDSNLFGSSALASTRLTVKRS